MTKDEALKLALKRAFQLGQNYWSWADSEYSSHWEKADAAKAEFDKLVEDTTLTTPPAAQREWVGLTDEQIDEIWRNHLHRDSRVRAIEAKLKQKNGY